MGRRHRSRRGQHSLPRVVNPSLSPQIERREISRIEASFSSGPLPPPSDLAKYDQVFPGCAQRIVQMAESQSQHRQTLESAVVRGNVRRQAVGQWLAFVLGLVTIIGGIVLIALNKDALGLAAIISAFATLAGVFIYGQRQQAKERSEKRTQG